MELLIIVAVLVIFELAVARWAFDSRDGFSSASARRNRFRF